MVVSFDATFPEDCGGIIGGPAPAEPPYPGEPTEPVEPAEPPAEPLPASSPGTQVIHGVVEVALTDISDEPDWGYDSPPVIAVESDY